MRVSFLILLISLPLLCGTTIYRWTDADGKLHFGDDPPEGAEEIEVGEPAVVSSPSRRAPSSPPAATQADEPQDVYRVFELVSPANDAVVRDNLGRVSVSIEVDPPLRAGHQMEVRLDGAQVPEYGTTRSTAFTLQDVYRGTHTLEVRVVDSGGAVLERSANQFHMHRASVHSPARRNN